MLFENEKLVQADIREMLTLPEWCKERNIFVLGGIELAAYQLVKQPLKIKTSRCSYCGECCIVKGDMCINHRMDGENVMCRFNAGRPVSCTVKDFSYIPKCTEAFKIFDGR